MIEKPLQWAIGITTGAGFAAVALAPHLERLAEPPEPTPSEIAVAAPVAAAKPAISVAADFRGHFIVHPTVERQKLTMIVDPGASLVALTEADAEALGYKPSEEDRRVSLRTANGTVSGTELSLREIRLGEIVVRNVRAVVLPATALSVSLLGGSFLGKLSGYEVQSGRITLRG